MGACGLPTHCCVKGGTSPRSCGVSRAHPPVSSLQHAAPAGRHGFRDRHQHPRLEGAWGPTGCADGETEGQGASAAEAARLRAVSARGCPSLGDVLSSPTRLSRTQPGSLSGTLAAFPGRPEEGLAAPALRRLECACRRGPSALWSPPTRCQHTAQGLSSPRRAPSPPGGGTASGMGLQWGQEAARLLGSGLSPSASEAASVRWRPWPGVLARDRALARGRTGAFSPKAFPLCLPLPKSVATQTTCPASSRSELLVSEGPRSPGSSSHACHGEGTGVPRPASRVPIHTRS